MTKSKPKKATQYEYIVVAGKHQDTNEDGTRYFAYAGDSVMLTPEDAEKFPGKFRRRVIDAPAVEQADTDPDKVG